MVVMIAIWCKAIYQGLYEELFIKIVMVIFIKTQIEVQKQQQMHMVFIWGCKSAQSTEYSTNMHPK